MLNSIKIILGIETSCDETAAAVLERRSGSIKILSNIVASSAPLQAKYGGIVPEQAAREQLKSIIPVIKESLGQANIGTSNIDSIAVTSGPGLIGSLLVGVETAKVLSLVWDKPLIQINHLIGHFYANWINTEALESRSLTSGNQPLFPCLGLLVSGGHTDLVLFQNHGLYKYLGGTRDDAAGECFDKCARLLDLPYPGGPHISNLAKKGNPNSFKLPRPMINSDDYDFSFSGLKTAVSNLVQNLKKGCRDGALSERTLADLSASIQQAIIDCLIKKTVKAIQKLNIEQIMLAGGVAANQRLVSELKMALEKSTVYSKVFTPPPYLCTDNGAMIAAAAFFERKVVEPSNLQINPNLSLVN